MKTVDPRLVTLVVGLLCLPSSLAGADSVESIAHRLRAYVERYETQIAAVVADEDYSQSLDGNPTLRARRRLKSDVAFLRLPGDLDWLSHRSVRTVDGRPVGGGRQQLFELLTRSGVDAAVVAKVMVEESASYNLGRSRTINVPTLPLDLLHPRRAKYFSVEWRSEGRRAGRRAVRLRFREPGPGAIIRAGTGYVRADIDAWIEPGTGALIESTVDVFQEGESARAARVRVEFQPEPSLGLFVPVRMDEWFPPDGRGRATYRNYGSFRTGSRIVPPAESR